MIRHRSVEDKEEVRQAMLEATRGLLLDGGYHMVTLGKVGKKVGFTTTNVYRYFKDKNDLIYAAIEELFVELGVELARLSKEMPDPVARIFAFCRSYLDFAERYPISYRLMFIDEFDLGDRPVPGLSYLGYVTTALDQAIRQGTLRTSDVEGVAYTVWGMLHGVVMALRLIPGEQEEQKNRIVARTMRCIEHALGGE